MPRWLLAMSLLLTEVAAMVQGELVNLSPDDHGDRIARVSDGEISHLPAERVELRSRVTGGGHCRYIRRTQNGDLHVTGSGLEGIMYRSTDGGHTWTQHDYTIEHLRFVSAFTILRDDTFLLAFRHDNHIMIARSTDRGRSWSTTKMNGDIGSYRYVFNDNNDLCELQDGSILLTVDLSRSKTGDYGDLAIELRGHFPHVFRSSDGGRTWGERSMISFYGAETHLIQLPSGKVLACIRKQRWHRLPGDPATVGEMKRHHGFRPQFPNEDSGPDQENGSNRFKNIFVTESDDEGRTWVNERRFTDFLQCPGDFVLLPDGRLVLTFLHRFPDDVAHTGIRALISDDLGKTWHDETYIISQGHGEDIDSGSSYPGNIAMLDGTLITVCANWHSGRTRLEAVHWRPPPAPGSDAGRMK